MITIKDVAKKAGVHPSVVSRVLNKDVTLKIKKETRDRILITVEELGYVPNHSARNLKRNETMMIGMIIPGFSNPVYSSIIHGAENKAAEEGYNLLVYSKDQKGIGNNYFSHLIEGRIDGLLIAVSEFEDKDIKELAELDKPFILVNRFVEGIENHVVLDDEKAGYMAANHLIELGHTDIAHITGPFEIGTGINRYKGFKDGIKDGGIELKAEYIRKSAYTIQSGYDEMNQLLKLEGPPTAVFAANIMISLGAMRAVQEKGLEIPTDISIIGIHDVAFAPVLNPPLTTIKMPLYEMGEAAVKKIVENIKGKSSNKDMEGIIIEGGELIVRDSTKAFTPE